MSKLTVLMIGDVVGKNGTDFLKEKLGDIVRENNVDFVIANGENSGKGNGITPESADEMLRAGVDFITTGNHVYQRREAYDFLDDTNCVIRPANYPPDCPGRGWAVVNTPAGRILIANIMGVVFLNSLDSPFTTLEKILEREKDNYDFSIVDFHAEATSEKYAMARYFDGKVNVIAGTHTHVMTADLQILPGGTGYITDLGMTGPKDSVLGMKNECILRQLITKMPTHFVQADGESMLCGAVFTIDNSRVSAVKAIQI